MRRSLGIFVLCAAVLALPGLTLTTAAAEPLPTHSITVTGTDVAMYPAFSPAVERYGVTTTTDTGGSVTVHATTTDPAGLVLVDGRVAAGGEATVTGLTEGEEISVIFQDSGRTSVHSLVYLPAGFPAMTEVVPAAPTVAGDDVLVNLGRYANDATPNFEAVLDRQGVPRYVKSFPATNVPGDFKPAGPAGHFTVSRNTTTPGRTGSQLVELDARFREVRHYETQGLVNTDGHDSLLRPDGSRILLAYEPNSQTGLTDAVIQEVDAQGHVVYTWNSADHLDPAAETTSTVGDADYAHLNSIAVMSDGDLLASFRHLSAVLKIAWHAHDGFQRGDIVWRLGGRHSDFDFVDDPYPSGPCAQHSATQLADGHILIYDNGSITLGADPKHCVDPADPTGPTVARQQSRVTEYALDTTAGTARLVWSYQVNGRFTYFAGSARRLANGNTLIGWAAERRALATEVSPTGTVLWELKNDDGYLSYRAIPAVVPDAQAPVVGVTRPTQGATYEQGQAVTADATCTDQGGSSLATCAMARGRLDTSTAGRHTYRVVATDGAGNRTTRDVGYTVAPLYRPDTLIRGAGGGWLGGNVYVTQARQTLRRTFPRDGAVRAAVVRLQNDGRRSDRLQVRATPGSARFRVTYLLGGRNVTAAAVAGTLRTAALAPGRSVDLVVRVTRLRPASAGHRRALAVVARSITRPAVADRVTFALRATR